MTVVRARLEGGDAELGRVAASDIARLILGLERALAGAAYVVLGESRRGTGRHRQAIENASRLRFVGVESGSVVGVLALPEADSVDAEFPFPVPHLSDLAFERVLDTINGGAPGVSPELAAAVARLAATLGIGDRNTSLTLTREATGPSDKESRHAVLDASVRERMHRLAAQPQPVGRDQALVGLLFEADFEEETAKLRLPDGGVVTVAFPPELADDIHEVLRSQARLDGIVRYDPRTSQATHVELRTVERSMQVALDAEAFWRAESFAAIQEAQGTAGEVDPAGLAINDLSDRDRADFLAALSA
jgi:hypothetical protein